ncbi:hypothetical protein JCM4814A_05230 [Streptomyces phaeofaciens JCM 4814]|uniref:Uncharacterized protein n=1 Tax=Streptomyces phaeofaciens TaxID=68254 RepID=A0A918HD02_9ACTN|nr:hypothetical protein GCM10010226_35280 [Streptomyces phaeofaciens]
MGREERKREETERGELREEKEGAHRRPVIPPMYLGRRGRYDGVIGVDKGSVRTESEEGARPEQDCLNGS